jgi:hypothetical protein
VELIVNYKRIRCTTTMHNCCITETNIEERNSMQVWLQRTVGCIALSSLGFFGANLWGCVGWVVGGSLGVCMGWHW